MRALLLTLGLVLFCTSARAQPVVDWKTDCGPVTCRITGELRDGDSVRPTATFIAVATQGDPRTRMGVALPLGAALKQGVLLVLDTEEVLTMAFDVCLPDGCRALRALTRTELGLIAEAASAEIRFFRFGSETLVSLAMPLAGLNQAVAEARARLGD